MEVYGKDIKDLKRSIAFVAQESPTVVHVLAVSKDRNRNSLEKVSCGEGVAIAGYRTFQQDDSFLATCCGRLKLGSVPVSYSASVPGCGNWAVTVPMPEEVLRRYMTADQRRSLKEFKDSFEGQDVAFEYVQMTSAF